MNNFLINNSTNYTNDNLINIDSTNKITNKSSSDEITTSELSSSIKLDPDKKNIINKINANEAFKKTSEDMELSKEEEINLRLEYARIRDQMRDHGFNVPDFDLNNSDPKTSSFLPFISEMKEFSKTYFSTGDHLVSSDAFLNFCDKFEENLKKYDCF
ncbi:MULTISPECIES: DNA-binding protein [Clostridium]|uniref:DNA-binding protein n=1 Tax=Clostridium TaxID=1485 RepID=UPI00257DA155|nr:MULTISPECIES: DNA-binding protein [Clostridium]MBS4840055.1 DNA-binding protein [Clostridium sp.]MDU1401188.1 DNA-binding protein [Clostridium sp.]MDU1603387.1 DNA-binding protein [Clostridium sp.]MDU2894200.1 DNA-binding protein [Clostridium sp.]MDU3005978.1 DNA-binding protein [Clostridium sp.]